MVTESHPGDDVPVGAVPGPEGSRRLRPVVAASVAVLACLTLVLGLVVGARLGSSHSRAAPSESSVDAGFARDMQAHHSQAVQMAMIIRDGTDDPDVSRVALDIALSQQHQSGQMYAWLEHWGLPQRSALPVMSWMPGHDHGATTATSLMPGMATQAQVNALDAATGLEAERLFLTLMIEHHIAGVDMAVAAANGAGEEPVRHLAQAMVAAQKSEIALLEKLLSERGGRPSD
jgi:uncharacterized protein (DUF305 family)